MSKVKTTLFRTIVAALLVAVASPGTPATAQGLKTTVVASGFNRPVAAAAIRGEGEKRRILVGEEQGVIKLLDLSSGQSVQVGKLGEDVPGEKIQILDLVLHPKFNSNRQAFISYQQGLDDTCFFYVVMMGIAEPGAGSAPKVGREVLKEKLKCGSATGGGLSFGEADQLFIGVGVGKERPGERTAQDSKISMGKILRIAVDKDDPYGIPEDNPYAAESDSAPLVWAVGVRDPYRVAYEPKKKQLYVIDRGTGLTDEVNLVQKAGNYGWPMFEGSECQMMRFDCIGKRFDNPVFTNSGSKGRKLTGGVVNTAAGSAFADRFVFAESTAGTLFALPTGKGGKQVKAAVNTGVSAVFASHGAGVYVLAIESGQVIEVQ